MRRREEGRTCPNGHWLYGKSTAQTCYECRRAGMVKPKKRKKPVVVAVHNRCRSCQRALPPSRGSLICQTCEDRAAYRTTVIPEVRPLRHVPPYLEMTITSTGKVVRFAIPPRLVRNNALTKRRRRR